MFHCVKFVRIQSYLVQMWENTVQSNSEYGQFLSLLRALPPQISNKT